MFTEEHGAAGRMDSCETAESLRLKFESKVAILLDIAGLFMGLSSVHRCRQNQSRQNYIPL
jgi:hypothetical protein